MAHAIRLLALVPLLAAGVAAAQDGPVHLDQQPSAVEPAGAQVGVAQIAPPDASARAPAQVGAPDRATRPAAQVTGERGGTSAGPQLSQGGTAESPEPLSRPSEGRTGAVARVEGRDRCAADADEAKPAVCARPIETRAAEFARPVPPVLSPEQRLLVDQRLREAGMAQRAAAEGRINPNAVDPDRLESQALAAVALDGGARDEKPDPATADAATLPPAAAALIEAIVQRAGGQPPQ